MQISVIIKNAKLHQLPNIVWVATLISALMEEPALHGGGLAVAVALTILAPHKSEA